VQECLDCGRDNPEGSKFCSECGSPLQRESSFLTEERKVVTVLFCDLVGFTAASDRSDPEDIKARLHSYHSRVRAEIDRFGGTVEKFIGDAVMAAFGAPTAHEDDPERAVRSALRILEAISDLNEHEPGLDLRVRIGIETGETVVSLGGPDVGEGIVTGQVVNTASRLQGIAPEGSAIVGPGTHAATHAVFDYEPLGPLSLKGKAEAIQCFRVIAARSRFGTDLSRGRSTPFVGRQIDLGILTGSFQKAVQESVVQLVTVVGEPGAGKSRLVAELGAFVDAWPDLIRWRQGRCLPYGDAVTFWALGEVVKAEAGIFESDAPDVVASKIDAVVAGEDPQAVWLRQRLRPLVGLEAPLAARDENFAAWRAFLERLAESRPTVLVFEDLHWADDAFLGFLEELVGSAQGVPLLLVGTSRPELFEKAPTWASTARNFVRVNLAPLSETEMSRLVSNLTASTRMPDPVDASIVAKAEGNPLYAEEFVRLLTDREATGVSGDDGRGTDNDIDIPLPAGIMGLIAARLDTLSPERKRLLQDASVIGKVFWSQAVADMASQDPSEVSRALRDLTLKELVRSNRGSSMEGQSEFSFHHSLIRDVCYGQIPRGARAERHLRAVDWIEKVSGDRVEDHAEILAAHLTTALELAEATKDASADSIRSSAAWYLMRAGDRAMGIDPAAAERHYAHALEVVSGSDARRPQILFRHAEAQLQAGHFREAVGTYDAAVAGFAKQGDARSEALAMGREAIAYFHLGDERNVAATTEALGLLEPLGPSAELVQALTEVAGAKFVYLEPREAVEAADRAITLAAQLGVPEPARALGFRGGARAWMGDGGGLDDMRRAVDLAMQQSLSRDVGVIYGNLSEASYVAEGTRAWLDVVAEGIAFAEERGLAEIALHLSTSRVAALVDSGNLAEAQALIDVLAPRLERAGDALNLVNIGVARIRTSLRGIGSIDTADDALSNARGARESGNPELLCQALPAAAAVQLQFGDRDGAIALLGELEAARATRFSTYYPTAVTDAVRVALGAGEPGLARSLVDGLEPTRPLREHALVSVEALIAEEAGDLEVGEDAYREAADRWDPFGVPWESAHARAGLGRCLARLGRADESVPEFQAALDIAQRFGFATTPFVSDAGR
jgi:class 3 adenylate cyclase/tetratricopeptide (TPR) repeat protein